LILRSSWQNGQEGVRANTTQKNIPNSTITPPISENITSESESVGTNTAIKAIITPTLRIPYIINLAVDTFIHILHAIIKSMS